MSKLSLFDNMTNFDIHCAYDRQQWGRIVYCELRNISLGPLTGPLTGPIIIPRGVA
jgi:hypothetical protein